MEIHQSVRAEQEKQVCNIYLTGIAGRVRAWLQNIQDLDAQILAESPGEKIALCARQIRSIGRILSFTMDGGADASRLVAGHLKKEEEEYSAEDLILAFEEIALTMTAGTDVAVQTDISPTIARRSLIHFGAALGIGLAIQVAEKAKNIQDIQRKIVLGWPT